MARPTGIPTTTIPVRFTPELMEKVKQAAKLLNWKDVDVVRLATEIGLVRLKRINYDLATVIDRAADAPSQPFETLKVATDEGEYKEGKKAK